MVVYEWDAESITDDEWEEVADHNHGETAMYVLQAQPLDGHRKHICLVRDANEREDRSWAYLEDGKLPEWFEDASGRKTARVPKRFHEELRKAQQVIA